MGLLGITFIFLTTINFSVYLFVMYDLRIIENRPKYKQHIELYPFFIVGKYFRMEKHGAFRWIPLKANQHWICAAY